MQKQSEIFEIAQLIYAERHWRDTGQWERMRSAYHPTATVRVAWFRGSGFDFVETSKHAHGRSLSKHRLAPCIVCVNGDRGTAETDTIVEIRLTYENYELDLSSRCRLFSRVRRDEGIWRLASLDVIYEKDSVSPVNPSVPLPIDWEEIEQYRPAYRFLCYYNWHAFRRSVELDLPGDDRPELVASLYAEAEAWLQQR
ncbi:nuclear transport factor 2 family protein [Ktedonosporobacter rubrisoli]|uniref:nuclear transport factor 2 family protein n=1 Tax=Ktedonosporobacter rubrisoli TaxID=2509675 RepID=UPI0013EE818F|nr:nuclear transport factor 2 family protein [Ktedonosporobacter rubrisoli]